MAFFLNLFGLMALKGEIMIRYSYENGEATLDVYAQDNGSFIGVLIYYNTPRPGQEKVITIDNVRKFRGESIDEVIKQAEAWLQNNVSKFIFKQLRWWHKQQIITQNIKKKNK